MTQTSEQIESAKSGKVFLLCLVGFFLTFASVDAYFVYRAVNTHAGVVTENAYEKGLAYNETLEKAREQAALNIESSAAYEDGQLKLYLPNVYDAEVSAIFMRPTHKGHDLTQELIYNDNGYYEATVNVPLKGLWRAQIEAKWQNKETQQTQTIHHLVKFVY